jgi:hypothetical protein
MRHIRSFVLSLVLAPLIWALTGLGLVVQDGRAVDLRADEARPVGLAALAAAGLLVAVLALGRLSPLGPALAGLGFLSAVAYAPSLRLMVLDLPGYLAEALTRPADGYAVVLGVPLLATALSGRRWRRTPYPPTAYGPPPAPTLVSPPAPTLVSPAPTLVSPPPTHVSPPPTHASPTAATYPSPAASTFGPPPAATYGPPPPTLAAPHDPWQTWSDPAAANHWPAPGYGPGQGAPAGTAASSPWARPTERCVDEETDDLSAALLPLRRANPPHAR